MMSSASGARVALDELRELVGARDLGIVILGQRAARAAIAEHLAHDQRREASSAPSRGGSCSAAIPSSSAARGISSSSGKCMLPSSTDGLERVEQARFEALRRIARDAELLRDRIRGAKADAPHLVREPIRVLLARR